MSNRSESYIRSFTSSCGHCGYVLNSKLVSLSLCVRLCLEYRLCIWYQSYIQYITNPRQQRHHDNNLKMYMQISFGPELIKTFTQSASVSVPPVTRGYIGVSWDIYPFLWMIKTLDQCRLDRDVTGNWRCQTTQNNPLIGAWLCVTIETITLPTSIYLRLRVWNIRLNDEQNLPSYLSLSCLFMFLYQIGHYLIMIIRKELLITHQPTLSTR